MDKDNNDSAALEAWRELADHIRTGVPVFPDRYKERKLREVAAFIRKAQDCMPVYEAVIAEAENALKDYIPTLEKQGGMMGYGRRVLRELQGAIALSKTVWRT